MIVKDLEKLFHSFPKTEKYPVLFVGHGSPMNGVEDNVYARAWKRLGESLPRPQAILVVSAHWLSDGTLVDISEKPKTIHDFYGFPQELYELTYPAPGAPKLAEATEKLIADRDTDTQEYGLDHGAWIVLRRMYPAADIPVYQLSVDLDQPGQHHYAIGESLAPLRERGVLILGSGNIVHNLREIDWTPGGKPFEWATVFDEAVKKLLLSGEHEKVCDYTTLPGAEHAVPTPDHYYPLLYVLGAAGKDVKPTFPTEGNAYGSVSMRSVLFS